MVDFNGFFMIFWPFFIQAGQKLIAEINVTIIYFFKWNATLSIWIFQKFIVAIYFSNQTITIILEQFNVHHKVSSTTTKQVVGIFEYLNLVNCCLVKFKAFTHVKIQMSKSACYGFIPNPTRIDGWKYEPFSDHLYFAL